ncbi:MAG: TRM11 family SAM-dependent methyltransferase [Pseudonocardiaceae bacterium]
MTPHHATPTPHPATPHPATADSPAIPPTDDPGHPHPGSPAPGPAVSVWATAQQPPATQRKHRYLPASTAHPAKMLPAVAAYAITHYTQPGDLVLDPMCGIGTTLIEAIHLDRPAIGIEYEPRWAQVSAANLDLAARAGNTTPAQVIHGDARHLPALLPAGLLGQVTLVVTSPPYGPSTHGQVSATPGGGVHKRDHLYGNTLDRGNLANIGHHRLLSGFTRILAGLVPYLRPGGHVAITIRPWREHCELIDLPSQILTCATHAGLIPVERCVALLARLAQDSLVARGSFFQRDFITQQRAAGLPLHLIAHEDVVLLQRSPRPTAVPATPAPELVLALRGTHEPQPAAALVDPVT